MLLACSNGISCENLVAATSSCIWKVTKREARVLGLGLQETAIGPHSRLTLGPLFHCCPLQLTPWTTLYVDQVGQEHVRSACLCLLKAGFKGFVRAVLSIQMYSWGLHSQAGGFGFSRLKLVQIQLDSLSVLGL